LLVISDLSKALREEERQAWQRLVRVLGHELNNSLAPIKSIAGSLSRLIDVTDSTVDWKDDMKSGLEVIASRADALNRFMSSYSRLAKLPNPKFKPLKVSDWIIRVVDLDTRIKATVLEGPDVIISADGDQLDQLLINLLRNAIDASTETDGKVYITWQVNNFHVEILIEDEGPGISNTANLFVPFFTTKRNGSGIGLVLSRQIAEAHDGSITLENREEGGCRARLTLPLGD
ncbi:HAMP domain-containing histidine kinase, partial [bacterium]|nr:HAMP domain-containing histidine kinase [candidate division CSSED10-310 bacterium]